MSGKAVYMCAGSCKGSPFVPGVLYVVSEGPRMDLTTFREKGKGSELHYPRAWAESLIRRDILINHKYL